MTIDDELAAFARDLVDLCRYIGSYRLDMGRGGGKHVTGIHMPSSGSRSTLSAFKTGVLAKVAQHTIK